MPKNKSYAKKSSAKGSPYSGKTIGGALRYVGGMSLSRKQIKNPAKSK